MKIAEKGDTVKLHYTGKMTNGEVFDSSLDLDPFEFDLGAGQVIEGFEEGVLGMKEGESKTVEIPMEKAYGPKIDEYILQVPRTQLPPELEPEIGIPLRMPMPDGQAIDVMIVAFDTETITLDANPPLAGEDLIFDLELIGILKAENV
jgi:peptidylprolyl isomerase